MCWTTTTGGMLPGNRGSTVRRASMPPVDDPITISCRGSTRPSRGRTGTTGGAAGNGVTDTAGAGEVGTAAGPRTGMGVWAGVGAEPGATTRRLRKRVDAPAALTWKASFSARSPTVVLPPGLASTSTAPASMASIASCDPACVSELTTTTGSGCCAIRILRKVSPSILGISMSSVRMSGWSRRIFSRAT